MNAIDAIDESKIAMLLTIMGTEGLQISSKPIMANQLNHKEYVD